MKIVTRAAAVLLAASALGANVAAAQDFPDLNSYKSAGTLTASQETIKVSFLYSVAASSNALYLFTSVGNPVLLLITVPGGTPPTPNVGAPLSAQFDLSTYGLSIGDELIFALCTTNSGGGTGCESPYTSAWYIGDINQSAILTAAQWNAFSIGTAAAAGAVVVGFENRAPGDALNDEDYNDLVFSFENVSTVPEPATMGLLAFGLVGLGGAGLARRRNRVS